MTRKRPTQKSKPERTPAGHRRYDSALLFPTILLVGLGIVMVYSASSALSLKVYGHGYYYLKRQAVFALAGVVASRFAGAWILSLTCGPILVFLAIAVTRILLYVRKLD